MDANDLSAVLVLAGQLGHKPSLLDLESRFRFLQNDTTSETLVGTIENKVIAFMQLSESATLMSGRRAEINALVVLDIYRGRGFGARAELKLMSSIRRPATKWRNLGLFSASP